MGGRPTAEIASQQVLLADASVYSVQWLELPAERAGGVTAAWLLERYLEHVRRATLGLVRPRHDASGVSFRCGPWSLLSFTHPQPADESAALLAICGGLLVQRDQCQRGQLVFTVTRQERRLRLSLEVSDYCPLLLGSLQPSRLRVWLYRSTQAALHRLVTVRFLARVCRELLGAGSRVRVVAVNVRPGEPV